MYNTVYDRIFGDIPAKNTVYTLYILWFNSIGQGMDNQLS
jgi:hypothetical protein